MDAPQKKPTENPLGFCLGSTWLSETKPKLNPLLPVTYYLLNSPFSPSGLSKTVMKLFHHSFSKLRGHA